MLSDKVLNRIERLRYASLIKLLPGSRRGIVTRYDEQTMLSTTIDRESFSVSNTGDLPSRDRILEKRKQVLFVSSLYLSLYVQWGEDWLNNADIGDLIRRLDYVIDYSNYLH